MKSIRAFFLRISGLFSSPSHQQDRDEELASHLQLHIDDNLRSGMSPEEARRQAILHLGGIEPTRQAWRERDTLPLIEHFLQDLRFALRQLRKNPGFTLTAVLVLSLGIAASTAIFGFVDAALIQPLPYPEPNRLADVTESVEIIPHANLSYLDYLDWKRLNNVFSSLDAYTGTGFTLNTTGNAEVVAGARVSDGFFRTLGIKPFLGRDFYSGEGLASGSRSILITYNAWQNRFAGKKDIVGHTVNLSGEPYTVIGVLPPGFQFAPRGRAEVWTTLQANNSCEKRRSCHNLVGVGRLKDNVSIQTASEEMKAIASQLEKQYSDSNRGQGSSVMPLAKAVTGDIRPILLTLLAGACLLLTIACINVASLLLVRSESRRREFAVRQALGASQLRIVRQFVTEAAILTFIALALGQLLAHGSIQLLTRLIPVNMLPQMPWIKDLGLNLHSFLFAVALSACMLLLFSLTPILRTPANDLRESLTEGSRSHAGTAWRRLGSNLVVFELAIAVVLLVGAGLLGKSFYRLLHVDLNFQPDHLAMLNVYVPNHDYPDDKQVSAVTRQLIERISHLPGVQSVSVTNAPVVTTNGNTYWIRFVGRPYDGHHIEVPQRDVSPTYFTTLQAKLLRGRFFTDSEDSTKPQVAIINNALAKKYYPNEDPIGKQFGDTALTPKSIVQIVGVIDDIREGPLDSEIRPAAYFPIYQNVDNDFTLLARTSQPEESVLPTLATTMRQTAASVGITEETSMARHINDSQTTYLHRSSAWLVAGFATLALLLGTVGLYGVIAYSVSQRTREIGVRMALGAQRSTIHNLILKEAGRLSAWGIAAGILCSLAATTLLDSMLFGVRTWDIANFSGVIVLLASAALLASYIPAHRAASINPTEALRAE